MLVLLALMLPGAGTRDTDTTREPVNGAVEIAEEAGAGVHEAEVEVEATRTGWSGDTDRTLGTMRAPLLVIAAAEGAAACGEAE